MGKKSRDKGARNERNIVELIQRHGVEAKRVPLSGMMSGYKGDIKMGSWNIECKVRANGFKQIYNWLDDCKKNDIDFLIIKADRRDAQVVMDLRDLLDILLDRHTKTINQIRIPQMAKWGH